MSTKIKYLLRDGFLCLVMASAFIVGVSFLVVNLSIFDPFTKAFKDFSFFDIYYSEKLNETTLSDKVILVNVEQADRFQIQELLRHIQDQNPKVIGLDIIFKGEKDPFVDSLLQIQLEKDNVVRAKAYVEGKWNYDFGNTQKKLDNTGYTNINFGSEETVIREFQAFHRIGDSLHASLAATVVSKYLENNWPEEEIQKKLSRQQPINYTGNLDAFLNFSYDECMSLESIPAMEGKIVLVGYLGYPHQSPTDIEDKFFTPLNPVSAGKGIPDMFGMVIHANIIQQILDENYFWEVPAWVDYLTALSLTYFGIVFFIWISVNVPAGYALYVKISQLGVTVLFLWLTFALYNKKIIFEPEHSIAFFVIGMEFIELYEVIAHKLNKKYQWKSYYHD